MLRETGVHVIFGERLDLNGGVIQTANRIDSLRMESGLSIAGRMFIDATYEGDLMAKAGVSYAVGREANSVYGESINGVQFGQRHHQFKVPIDPYLIQGDPSSGLLPGIHDGDPGRDGEGDRRVQAYNFRMCMTDAAENRLPWPKPESYDPLRYELLLRYIDELADMQRELRRCTRGWDADCHRQRAQELRLDIKHCRMSINGLASTAETPAT